MNFKQKIQELNLPNGSYVAVGSGILGALGIRDTNDIDLVVTDDVYAMLDAQGWTPRPWSDHIVLTHDVFDAGRHWYGKRVPDLLKTAEVIDGIPYLSLDDVYEWKKKLGRPKDIKDLALIDAYREQ